MLSRKWRNLRMEHARVFAKLRSALARLSCSDQAKCAIKRSGLVYDGASRRVVSRHSLRENPQSYFICRLLANRCPRPNFFHLFSFPLLTPAPRRCKRNFRGHVALYTLLLGSPLVTLYSSRNMFHVKWHHFARKLFFSTQI